MSIGDRYWERIKLRAPQLADWDMIRDQSQTHHTLTIGLAYGVPAALLGLVVLGSYAQGFALGIAAGLVRYVIRERLPFRLFASSHDTSAVSLAVDKWDGTLDVLVPVARLGPFALACWVLPMPTWLVLVAQLLLAAEALGYSVFRPAGSLFYGGRGLREDVCR